MFLRLTGIVLPLAIVMGRSTIEKRSINIGSTKDTHLRDVNRRNMILFDRVSYWIDTDHEQYSPMFKRNIYSLHRLWLSDEPYNVWSDLHSGKFRL